LRYYLSIIVILELRRPFGAQANKDVPGCG
jgi:hypothetical protein